MNSKKRETSKSKIILIYVAVLVIMVVYIFLLCNCINSYLKFEIDYDDLLYEELTFDKFEIIHRGKGGDFYKIYFKEYIEPFQISSITKRAVDVEAVESLKENTCVSVYYSESYSRNYEYVICEMNLNSNSILKLSDYVKANQDNQVVGIIVCTVLAIACLFLVWIFNCMSKIDYSGRDIGKVRLEYIFNGNVIRVYNAPVVCSLVINDKIVDQEYGLESYDFRLKGNLQTDREVIPVEARVKGIMIRLYVKGKRVSSKFVGFT